MLDKLNTLQSSNKLAIYFVLVLAILAVYWQVNKFDFAYIDDEIYVTENSHIQSGLTLEGIRWAFGTNNFPIWIPLVWISLMLDHQFFGLNPGGYHLTNLVLHILSTLLLFWLFVRMTKELWKSAFIAAFFALHPLHVESVAWITERKDVLSAFFWMLTLCLYVYYSEKPIVKRYLLVLFSFVLAIMSKPMVITLPLIMILLDYWLLKRFDLKRNHLFSWELREKMPFFILSILLVIVNIHSLYSQHGPDTSSLKAFSLYSRLSNVSVSFANYLIKTFWPHDMAFLYPFSEKIQTWQILGASLLITIVCIAVIILAKRLPYLLVGWLWFAIVIIPVIGIIQINYQSMTDRYHYLPSIGISIMMAWGIASIIKSKDIRKKILLPAGIVFLSIMSIIAWKQCQYWVNTLELSKHALRVTKNNSIAHKCLADALFNKDKTKEAIYHYSEAIRINPYFINARLNRANSYCKIGLYQYALGDLNEAILIRPDYAIAWNRRGEIYDKLGQNHRAIEDFSKAISLKPDYANAYNNRGNLFDKLSQHKMAIDDLSKAISIESNNPLIYFNRGISFISIRKYESAIDDFNKAIFLNPVFFDAYNNRGIIYLKLGKYQLAIANFSQAIHLKPDYADAWNNRAFVYLNTGNAASGCGDAVRACELGNCATLQVARERGLCR